MNTPFYVFMKLLPKNAASRAFGIVTRLRIPFVSKALCNVFANYYKLNMEESEYPLSHYRNIGELFIRRLKPGARPIADSEIVSPVDGVLSQTGVFDENQKLIQAKGKYYTLKDLLRNEEMAKRFEGGAFATIYLAPFNYHRIHSPVKGELVDAAYCPGTLWPVNVGSVERVEGLFCINERLTSRIRLEDGSEILVVKVGATNVGRIGVVYSDELLVNAGRLPRDCKRFDWVPSTKVIFEKGGELGRFEMGSTVILVVDKKIHERHPELFTSRLGQAVKVGEAL
ncbi:archaetidylserine decarboxylase [Fibrobacter sp.]|uniref:archaetidylserine decarboxylase n=1 Tax=Fibrobacter sp. TaxID=35828 RepID=UPI0025C5D732|nr:archaetidylserine decarboxylase [Fibrobacter sp.]MBR2060271.1 phosphatidylserine decarboxylase [Fibrobacter sp.]MBR2306269.1 phosphatidylserine decarboxylase [Fibrobacter sp.]MBR4007724.1 phosphatidylserine decarboxylase [Fibrobacter sp.]